MSMPRKTYRLNLIGVLFNLSATFLGLYYYLFLDGERFRLLLVGASFGFLIQVFIQYRTGRRKWLIEATEYRFKGGKS